MPTCYVEAFTVTTTAVSAPAQARLGRPCTVCRHPDRALIEYELSSGEHSMRGIARRHELAPENIRRHVRGHVAESVRTAMIATAGTPALTIAARLFDVADAARDSRLAAEESGDTKLALAAGLAEARTLATIADRLGVTEADVAANVHDAADVMRIITTVVNDHGADVTAAVIDSLERRNRTDWADRIRQLAGTNPETNTREVTAS
jgi:hypothetical protein